VKELRVIDVCKGYVSEIVSLTAMVANLDALTILDYDIAVIVIRR